MMKRTFFIGVAVLIFFFFQGFSHPEVFARDEAQKSVKASGPDISEAEDFLGRLTPRGTVNGFLEAAGAKDFSRAAHYLDLRAYPAEERTSLGPLLAKQLKFVLDRELNIDPAAVSQSPSGAHEDGVPPSVEKIGQFREGNREFAVTLRRLEPNGPNPSLWLFSDTTVWNIPAMYQGVDYGILQRFIPKTVLEFEVFQVKFATLAGLLITWVVSLFLGFLLARALFVLLSVFRAGKVLDFFNYVKIPFYFLMMVLISRQIYHFFILFKVERVIYHAATLVILGSVWFALRCIDYLSMRWGIHADSKSQIAQTLVIPSINRAIKLIILLFGISLWLTNLGVNVSAILAGLGIGGVAVALASQKSIEDLFGAVTILSEKPFKIGDVIKFGDRTGVVQEIDLRYTFIRTPERSVISVPNAHIAAMQIENLSKRDKFLFQTVLGMRYETTADQIRYLIVEIRAMLFKHPKVLADPARVRLHRLSAYSIDLEIFAYLQTSVMEEYAQIAQDLYFRIMEIFSKAGVQFAFPSQTVYSEKGGLPDPAQGQSISKEVARLREQNRLFTHEFPKEEIEKLRGTLPYPS